jgi:molecular chaperone DnaK (HSP70)
MSHLPDGETRYVIGIDLGTTNSAVAYVDLQEPSPRHISFLHIPQLISPGQIGNRTVLPSFLYLPGPYELPRWSTALPWDKDRDYGVGEFAREQGALVPGRLVSSAKSWLCHSGVDRTQAMLPWDSPADGRRISPVEAAALFLGHLRDAWNEAMAVEDPDGRLENQELYLTVPASFDAVARELTVQAAQAAGLAHMTLLEEPQAAVYAWVEASHESWRKDIRVGDSILVCDIGGGTTDFSLIQVTEEDGELTLDALPSAITSCWAATTWT